MVSTIVPVLMAAIGIIGYGIYLIQGEFAQGRIATRQTLDAIRDRYVCNSTALWSALCIRDEAEAVMTGKTNYVWSQA